MFVKVVYAHNAKDLEKWINEYLIQMMDYQIIDVKIQVSSDYNQLQEDTHLHFVGLITYKSEEPLIEEW